MLQECHRAPVTALGMVNVSGLLDMAGRILRDPVTALGSAAPGIFQGTCLQMPAKICFGHLVTAIFPLSGKFPAETIRPEINPFIYYSH